MAFRGTAVSGTSALASFFSPRSCSLLSFSLHNELLAEVWLERAQDSRVIPTLIKKVIQLIRKHPLISHIVFNKFFNMYAEKKKIKLRYMSRGENVDKVCECDIQGNCLAEFYIGLLSPTAKIAVIKLSCTIQYEVLDIELLRCLPRC